MCMCKRESLLLLNCFAKMPEMNLTHGMKLIERCIVKWRVAIYAMRSSSTITEEHIEHNCDKQYGKINSSYYEMQ